MRGALEGDGACPNEETTRQKRHAPDESSVKGEVADRRRVRQRKYQHFDLSGVGHGRYAMIMTGQWVNFKNLPNHDCTEPHGIRVM
jgi:hypothetical protein